MNSDNKKGKGVISKGLRTIAILSGKGGTGKSIIVASLGHLIAHCGYKVLLIDTDFITRGLSYYLMADEPYNAQHGLINVFDSENNSLNIIDRLKINSEYCGGNLDLIPATSRIQAHHPSPLIQNDFYVIFKNQLQKLLMYALERWNYDYVLIDSHGGSSHITTTIAGLVDGYIIITEADKTSWDVTELLIKSIDENNSIKTVKQPTRLGFLLNKNTLPEKEIVSFLKQRFLCKDLAVIPLDIEAVRCFQNDEIPLIEDDTQPFSEGIVTLCNRLFRPLNNWDKEANQCLKEIENKIKKKKDKIDWNRKRARRIEQMRFFAGPFTVSFIAIFAAIFVFARKDMSKQITVFVLVFIAYMSSLSAFLANPKFVKILFSFFFRLSESVAKTKSEKKINGDD